MVRIQLHFGLCPSEAESGSAKTVDLTEENTEDDLHVARIYFCHYTEKPVKTKKQNIQKNI